MGAPFKQKTLSLSGTNPAPRPGRGLEEHHFNTGLPESPCSGETCDPPADDSNPSAGITPHGSPELPPARWGQVSEAKCHAPD